MTQARTNGDDGTSAVGESRRSTPKRIWTKDRARRECEGCDDHTGHTGVLTYRLTEKTRRRELGYCITADGVDINQAIIAQGANS